MFLARAFSPAVLCALGQCTVFWEKWEGSEGAKSLLKLLNLKKNKITAKNPLRCWKSGEWSSRGSGAGSCRLVTSVSRLACWSHRCVHFETVYHYVHCSVHLLHWNRKISKILLNKFNLSMQNKEDHLDITHHHQEIPSTLLIWGHCLHWWNKVPFSFPLGPQQNVLWCMSKSYWFPKSKKTKVMMC